MINGSSANRSNASDAIATQDLVKLLNVSGLKMTQLCFLLQLKMLSDILEFTDELIIDESIEKYESHEYETIIGTSFNNGGDIRISIKSEDVFTHYSGSYLIFEGRLTKADGTPYANGDDVALTNYVIMHHFSRIKYHLSNQLIESLNYPGQATTMLGQLKYPDEFLKAQGLNQLWYKTQQQQQLKLIIMDLLQGTHISSSHNR